MLTYLPLPDLEGSINCLDTDTLRRQCLDSVSLLDCLSGFNPLWQQHPAYRMWWGFSPMLCCYAHIAHDRHLRRTGSRLLSWYELQETVRRRPALMGTPVVPPWMGDIRLCVSHQSNLVRIDPERYGSLWPKIKPSPVWCWPWVERVPFPESADKYFLVVHFSLSCEEP